MKLIKLSEDHYIVVDDSEIKGGDWVIGCTRTVVQCMYPENVHHRDVKKITHSTNIDWHEVYYIPLSEVKELFSEDTDVWSRKLEYLKKVNENIKHKSQDERIWIFGASDLGFTAGYNQALEDNKERKYTKEDMQWALHHAKYHQELTIEQIIEALHQPKTEWDVEFVDGKLKLVQQ